MHHYLRSVGFSKIEKRKDVDKLIKALVKENLLNGETSIDFAGDTRVQVKAYVADDMGLTMVGTLDARGSFKLDAYYPFLMSEDVSTTQSVQVYERTEGQIFSGLLEDQRIGLTLIYLIDNPNDYIAIKNNNLEISSFKTKLCGFCSDGVILLPSMKQITAPVAIGTLGSGPDVPLVDKSVGTSGPDPNVPHEEPIEKMNSGMFGGWKGDIDNVPAEIEEMAIKEMSLYASVSRRVQNEDIYSIVDTSFMPHGVETDVYSIIGDIIKVHKTQNILSGEEIWNLTVSANDMVLHVVVNAADLQGEPLEGRRFKGSIWLMGRTDFVV